MLRRNDPAQYDQLADQWWEPAGGFAMLHWLAASRAEHVPPAPRPDAVLVDLACGGGLMAPHVAARGYRHVGVDLGLAGLRLARAHGVAVVRGSVLAVPLADGCADVVLAGEILEHVADHDQLLRECARLLKPGGTLVVDALAATRLADVIAVRIAERLPGGPPPAFTTPRSSSTGRRSPPPLDSWDWTSAWSASARRCGTWWRGDGVGAAASGCAGCGTPASSSPATAGSGKPATAPSGEPVTARSGRATQLGRRGPESARTVGSMSEDHRSGPNARVAGS